MKMAPPDDSKRVAITLEYAGFRAMQVCVVADATDEEILAVANRENPQLTERGWHTVVRDVAHAVECGVDEVAAPGQCVELPHRLHKICLCM